MDDKKTVKVNVILALIIVFLPFHGICQEIQKIDLDKDVVFSPIQVSSDFQAVQVNLPRNAELEDISYNQYIFNVEEIEKCLRGNHLRVVVDIKSFLNEYRKNRVIWDKHLKIPVSSKMGIKLKGVDSIFYVMFYPVSKILTKADFTKGAVDVRYCDSLENNVIYFTFKPGFHANRLTVLELKSSLIVKEIVFKDYEIPLFSVEFDSLLKMQNFALMFKDSMGERNIRLNVFESSPPSEE